MVEQKPLIGITGRRRKGEMLRGSLKVMNPLPFDVYWVDYAQGVIAAGGVPVFLPLSLEPAELIPRLDGLLMSGGADIDPKRYGAEPEPELQSIEPARDEFELKILELVYECELPVAGICRGLQILNVHAGGSLYQDVPPHSVRDKAPSTRVHDITTEKGSILEKLYGEKLEVNSLHHQSIKTLGKHFSASATSNDGIFEGIEHSQLPIVAVQWHPEMLDTRDSDPIFRWLVSKAEVRKL